MFDLNNEIIKKVEFHWNFRLTSGDRLEVLKKYTDVPLLWTDIEFKLIKPELRDEISLDLIWYFDTNVN